VLKLLYMKGIWRFSLKRNEGTKDYRRNDGSNYGLTSLGWY